MGSENPALTGRVMLLCYC